MQSHIFEKHLLGMKFHLVIVAVFGVLLSSSCQKEDPGTPGVNEVWLEYQLFRPSQLQVAVGTTVHFINKGNPTHTVTGALFTSSNIRTGEVYTYTFTAPGTYYFTCANHSTVTSEQVAVRVQ